MAAKYRTGDTVYCKIRGNSVILARDENFETQLPFEIIGYDKFNSKYVILIPKYFNIKNSWNIIEEHLSKLNINPNHLDDKAMTIFEDKIVKLKTPKSHSDGMFCNRCNEFFPMAEPNQSDGVSMRCYSCRLNPWR